MTIKWVGFGLVALLAFASLLWGVNEYREMEKLDRLNDPAAQNEMLASLLPGFRCDELDVIRVLAPGQYYDSFDGGAYLKLPANCRADLLSRVQTDTHFEAVSPGNCYSRDSITWIRDVCFEGDRIYFGSPIPG